MQIVGFLRLGPHPVGTGEDMLQFRLRNKTVLVLTSKLEFFYFELRANDAWVQRE